MLFTTQIFLFVFLPVCLAAYYLTLLLQRTRLGSFLRRVRAADLVLVAAGCGFYLWACFDDLFRFLAYIAVVWLIGRGIERQKSARAAKGFLIAGVGFALFVLVAFSYRETATGLWNFFFKASLPESSAAAPLGLSFITFSAISYLADIQSGRAGAGNLLDCALYLTFFPKVVSGPIVLWRDFRESIAERRISLAGISDGASRVMIGFAKKLILADTFGAALAAMSEAVDLPTAWFAGLLYMLQIYFDFSGYSDIAIGLSGMLGFSMKENFNFPYLSRSITEFWRRWHISLGTWFREYVYIPLGGSRRGTRRTAINVMIVFLLTGVWHGAGWGYLLWGLGNGLCNVVEKRIGGTKLYQKTPGFFKWLFTMLVTFFGWEIFRFGSLRDALRFAAVQFGLKRFAEIPYTWRYYLDARIVVFALIGIFFATVWGLPKVQAGYRRFAATKGGYLVRQLAVVLLFLLSILFLVNSKYSPFLYFQY